MRCIWARMFRVGRGLNETTIWGFLLHFASPGPRSEDAQDATVFVSVARCERFYGGK